VKSAWTKLGILLVLVLLVVSVVPFTQAQDDMGFRATFDLEGPAEDGALAGVDPSGQTVVWWHQHSGSREERLNEMIAEFNEQNPWGITVDASNQGSYNDIYQQVVAGLTTGNLPNLVVAYQNQSLAYLSGNGLVDMDIFVTDPTWGLNEAEAADYIGSFFAQDYAPDGTRIGFPPNRSIEVMYYNADAVAELGYDGPPTSWDEFREMACRFTEEGWSGYEGDTVGYSIRTDASNIAAMTYGFGEDIYDYETETFNYNNPGTVAALTFMQELLNDGCANLIAEAFGDQNDFAAGKNLFYMGSSSGLPFVQAAVNEGENPFNWSMAYIPYTEAPVVDVYGASVSILSADPEADRATQLAAWLFVRWYTEPEQQAAWAAASQYFPVRISSTTELDSIFAEIPQYEEAWNLLLGAESTAEPNVAAYDNIRQDAAAAFNTILTEGADVETTLEALDAQAVERVAEFE
jgi:multiple sugar transport system substrate-binding protein/sn-glycerol 3-phosphate transport system substrate-binding protein